VFRKIILGVVAIAVVLGATAWLMRADLILLIASTTGKTEVGPHQEITWQTADPARTSKAADGAPNIIFILADDLGINDISTYGGGMAGGTFKTPHIDRLAAEGANFIQAYSGTGTCAPSRAMLMTGRYPSRTGFEFTPTPNGMAGIVQMVSSSMDSGLPDAYVPDRSDLPELDYEDKGLPGSELTVAEVLQDAG